MTLTAEKLLQGAGTRQRRRSVSKSDYLAEGVLYVPEEARFQRLLELPEGGDVGK
jgi:type I restriction enzyme M protein